MSTLWFEVGEKFNTVLPIRTTVNLTRFTSPGNNDSICRIVKDYQNDNKVHTAEILLR